MTQEDPDEKRWREALTALLNDVPFDYPRRYQEFSALRESFYRQLAIGLAQPLRDYLSAMPQETFEKKAALAQQVNEELRRLGLALLCHRTYRPATLVAEADSTGRGYYALEVKDNDGHPLRTLSKRRSLPFIELTQNDPNIAPPLSARLLKSRGPRLER